MTAPVAGPNWLEQVRQGQSPERPWFAFLCAFSTWASLVVLAVLLLSVIESTFGIRDWLRYSRTSFPQQQSIQIVVQSHDKAFHGAQVPAIPVTVEAPGREISATLPVKAATAANKVIVAQSEGSTHLVSGGTPDRLEISLASRPKGHVVVTLKPDPLLDVGAGFGASKAFRFTSTSASKIQTAEVTAIDLQPQSWFDWQFISSYDSQDARQAGILAGILGTGWVVALTLLLAIPIGVGAAVYLEEYAVESWLTRLIRINLANLAGVPSIVYGILGLTVFVHMFGLFSSGAGIWWLENQQRYLIPLPFGPTVLSGSLTMMLLILPVIIVSAQEALRAVPPSLRHASLALGATRWQTIRHQVVPAALPGILTGVILAMSRAIGETAPLLMVGAVAFVLKAPGGIDSLSSLVTNPAGLVEAPFSSFVVVPVQIFTWISDSQREFHHLAAAGILVLLALLLLLNGVATYIRYRFEKYGRW